MRPEALAVAALVERVRAELRLVLGRVVDDLLGAVGEATVNALRFK